MLFYLLCIYVSLYYIRPFEWYGPLLGLPIFSVLGMICLGALFFAWATGKIRLFAFKTDYMMVGFVLAMILSHLSHGYFGGAIESVTLFLPSLVGYFLIAHGLDSRQKVDRFILLLIVLTTYLGYEAWLQHSQGFSHGGLEPLYQYFTNEDGIREALPRVRWYGMFNDPNDMGLALVVAVPFLIQRLFEKKYLLAAVCLPVLLYGIYLTNSRGAMLALLAAIFTFFVLRYRSKKGIILGLVLAAVVVVFGPSRMAEMSAGESSAYGRLEAWYAGFQMFKAAPFFGVGSGMFTEFHSLTAHNSYMLVLSELGIFGSVFFLGLFHVPLQWARANLLVSQESGDCRVVNNNYLLALYAALVGVMITMFFLSRSYTFLPFLLIGLLTARLNLEFNVLEEKGLVRDCQWGTLLALVACEIVLLNIFIKVLL